MKTVTKTITKKLVIEALEKEPLRASRFWHSSWIAGECDVCAVGAVLRRASFEKQFMGFNSTLIGKIATCNKFRAFNDWQIALAEKNYLGALSIFFERTVFLDVTPEDRKECINFVKKHFPSKFKLTIRA